MLLCSYIRPQYRSYSDMHCSVTMESAMMSTMNRSMSRAKRSLVYLAVTAAAIASFLSIQTCGEQLAGRPEPTTTTASAGVRASPDTLLHVLLALALVILVARVTAMALARIDQ